MNLRADYCAFNVEIDGISKNATPYHIWPGRESQGENASNTEELTISIYPNVMASTFAEVVRTDP